MIISYFRSSSFNKWDWCELSYFIEYVLGYTFPSGQKAEQGTIVHKVLECLAVIKKEIQDNPSSDFINDPQLGKIKFDSHTWLDVKTITKAEAAKINLSRKSKTIYKSKCVVEEGDFRRGVDLVEHIFDKAYNHYKDKSTHEWKPAQRRDCHNWTWMALDYKDGMFDPRLKTIVDAEPHFDITINRPWAKFEYENAAGEIISGNLAIKGTIDLITEVGPGILEICDYKSGQRVDWSTRTMEKKTFEKLCKDPQLMLYYYAARHLYPDAKAIILTIFFIRDGGPFSMSFDDSTMVEMERLLERRFKEIVNSKNPRMLDTRQKNFKCTRLCPFFKNSFDGSKNMCLETNELIKLHGIDHVTNNYTKEGHDIGVYNAPGE